MFRAIGSCQNRIMLQQPNLSLSPEKKVKKVQRILVAKELLSETGLDGY
jgi:hypothetical protein